MFSTAENAIYGVLCLITACLSISSLPVHVRAGNTGVILMMSWCFVGLFNKGVNALAFNHRLNISWNFGCDVSAVVERIWQLGLCCSSLCVLQRLESIASLRQAHSTYTDRRRRVCFDIAVGLGIPFLQIPLFFVVQPYRLDVVEDLGCSAPIYNSVPALFVYYFWRLFVSVLCSIYAALILRWFILRRLQFSAALSSQHSGLSQKKYFRLFALALCEATLIAVAQLYLLFAALRITGLLPYSSWEYVHSGFATINLVPMDRSGASSSTLTSLEVFRWFTLSPGIVLFVFFGLTEDAKSAYIGLWQAIKRLRFKVRPRKECGLTEGPTGFQDNSLDLDDLREQSYKVSVVVHKDVTVL
ncbi:putative Pheromone receptor a2 [Ustilago hordei]|nr:putative Pheromone receptor a2 [Ustilago hordei]SYW81867.1 probable Pheromone receptor a2 [Ustilago hordei]